MTPPEALRTGSNAGSENRPPAVSVCPRPGANSELTTLKNRSHFLLAARALRKPMPGFLLQARKRGPDEPADLIRIGYTCSKKVGNSVIRNRAKRRLREVARALLPVQGRAGWDYVLVGRPGATVARPWADLLADLETALSVIHQGRNA